MAVKFSNNAATLLAANASTSTTSLTVDNGSIFPTLSGTDHTYVTLEDVNANREVVKVTAISGNTLTVVRAQDGTTARAFSTADKCELRITAALLNDLNTDADTESVSIAGDTMTGNLNLGDNVKAQFGAGNDLQIYSDGTDGYIDNVTGDFYIRDTTGGTLHLQAKSNEEGIVIHDDGGVDIYRNNDIKLSTTSTGIQVGTFSGNSVAQISAGTTGISSLYLGDGSSGAASYAGFVEYNHTGDYLRLGASAGERVRISSTGIDVTGDITLGDANPTITFNDSSVTNLSHQINSASNNLRLAADVNGVDSGSRVEIFDGTTEVARFSSGAVLVSGTVTADGTASSSAPKYTFSGDTNTGLGYVGTDSVGFIAGGSRKFYVNGTTAYFQNLSGGVNVSGSVTADGLLVGDNEYIYAGNGADLKIGHDGSSNVIRSQGHPLYIDSNGITFRGYSPYTNHMNIASNGDISFYNDSAAQGLFWDSSASSLGIGTTSVNAKLHVSDTTAPTFRLSRTGTGQIWQQSIDSSGRFILQEAASEGGTKYTRLQIDDTGEATFSGSVSVTASNATASITGSSSTDATLNITSAGITQYAFVTSGTDSSLAIKKDGSTRLKIDTNGNVNIPNGSLMVGSTTAPTDKLDVAGAIRLTSNISFDTNKSGRIYKASNHGLAFHGVTGTENDFGLFTSSGQLMVVNPTGTNNVALVPTASGSVGIGTSSPSEKLSILGGHISVGDSSGVTGTEFLLEGYREIYNGSKYGNISIRSTYNPASNASDMLFYTASGGTNTAERMRIDSSGRVGIGSSTGTSAYGTKLFVEDSSAGLAIFHRTGSGGLTISADNDGPILGSLDNADSLRMFTGSAERLRIDSSGRVGIGTSQAGNMHTNANNLVVGSGSGTEGITINSGSANYGTIYFADGTSGSAAYAGNINYNHADNSMRLGTNGSTTDVVIDSSGDLLVGTTSSTLYSSTSETGTNITSQGGLYVAHNGTNVPNFNRITTNGDIVRFRKDGTVVGSIGSEGGDTIYIGTSDTGLRFHSADRIVPHNPATNTSRDAAIDLGRASERFKDAHFSGTVNTDAVSTNSLDLQAIAESKSVTAVDVFVYDTSKDSDGGAWRHRTQNTSWYNETLNTSTRGATKKFPAVAVIVAESNKVTIYDGDDPAMPMWMVFDQTEGTSYPGWSMLIGGDNDASETYDQVTSVVAINGRIVTGVTGVANQVWGGVHWVDFVSDEGHKVTQSINNLYSGKFPYGISEREHGLADGDFLPTEYSAIVNASVNDVAMTVLPNAPIDADTGLPVPTIAVATNGGVSVIKDDGTVVDLTHSYGTNNVVLDGKRGLVGMSININVAPADAFDMYYIPTTDISSSDYLYRYQGNSTVPALTNAGASNTGFHYGALVTDKHLIGANYNGTGTNNHPSLVYLTRDQEQAKQSVAYITSDYNTGWMHGDIKLATLSDTDTTNAVGTNLVTNGDFASNTTGWSSGNVSTLSVSGGQLVITATGAAYPSAKQVISVVPNQPYYYSVDIKRGTCNVDVHLEYNDSVGSGWQQLASHNSTTLTTFTGTIVPSGGTVDLRITIFTNSATTGHTAIADNVVLKLAENDRSVNGSGYQGKALGVFGTVTKTAVATGADLVAYSGFSSSNYLQQPYNSDLDFGTGDFCITMWLKFNTDNAYDGICDRAYYTGSAYSGSGFRIETGGNNSVAFKRQDGLTIFSVGYNPTGTWLSYTVTRKSGVIYVYVNGVLQGSIANTTDFTNVNAKLRVGGVHTGTPQNNTSTALFRISATAPTAEQIAKMYNDEKHLFQENAKATLYGTSDAVTALAYDDDTELLHAGTSAGRSVFQGLRRVENTTDAVGSAISASNGLVAED